jgi:hypothetical protein
MSGGEYRLARASDSAFGRTRLLLLGVWSGAMLAFGALFVPSAFAHLPTSLAATVLGEGFGAIDRGGIVLGAICVALGLAEQSRLQERGAPARLRALLPLAGVLAHVTSLVYVTPELHALRQSAGGAIGQLAPGDPGIEHFRALHSASRALFGTAAASALLAALWDLWERAAQVPPRASPDAGNP